MYALAHAAWMGSSEFEVQKKARANVARTQLYLLLQSKLGHGIETLRKSKGRCQNACSFTVRGVGRSKGSLRRQHLESMMSLRDSSLRWACRVIRCERVYSRRQGIGCHKLYVHPLDISTPLNIGPTLIHKTARSQTWSSIHSHPQNLAAAIELKKRQHGVAVPGLDGTRLQHHPLHAITPGRDYPHSRVQNGCRHVPKALAPCPRKGPLLLPYPSDWTSSGPLVNWPSMSSPCPVSDFGEPG